MRLRRMTFPYVFTASRIPFVFPLATFKSTTLSWTGARLGNAGLGPSRPMPKFLP
jgi:hypothetical protein